MTRHLPGTEVVSIYDAAVKYQQEGTPLAVIAGKEYGSGSSRDWAAKGRACLAFGWSSPNRSNVFTVRI
jgi:aconitase A